MDKRKKWIDYAKGIGILLVIIGHALPGTNPINIWIYSFHMPLFFVLSGLTLKEQVIQLPMQEVLKKYVISLLLPYYVFASLCALLEIIKDVIQKSASINQEIEILVKLVTGQGIKANWFLVGLFLSLIITIFLNKITRNKCLCIVVLFLAALGIQYITIDNDFLYVFLRAIEGAFFVQIGLMLNQLNKQENTITTILYNTHRLIPLLISGGGDSFAGCHLWQNLFERMEFWKVRFVILCCWYRRKYFCNFVLKIS